MSSKASPFRVSMAVSCLALLNACGSQPPAALVDHRHAYFGPQGKRIASANPVIASRGKQAKAMPEDRIPTASAAPVPAISSKEVTPESFTPSPESSVQPVPSHSAAPSFSSDGSFQWPSDGKIVSSFGMKSKGISENGIIIAAPAGSPIHASRDGMVVHAGNKLKPYGNMVILRHANGMTTTYAHAAELRVRQGQHVRSGDVIGLVGSSGNALSPQLFFAMREGDKSVDPQLHLPPRTQSFALND